MAKKRNSVCMNVDIDFFDNLFEPARKKTMKQLGLQQLGQRDFSQMIQKSGIKFDIKFNKVKVNAKKTKKR